MKKITIKDVAREAGVSVATVSNALNNLDVVQPKTREHVLAVAQRLNYIPNAMGKRLRGGQSSAIGLFVSAIAGVYYGSLTETMHYALQKQGYELQVYITDSVHTIMEKLTGHNLDGAIIHCNSFNEAQADALNRLGVPIVFLDMEKTGAKMSGVLFESYENGYMAADYLLGLGHKRLMHIFGVPGNYDSEQRFRGYAQALKDAGMAVEPEYVLNGRFERATAYREMRRFLQEGHTPPDAVFAANDYSAIGCIEALREFGLRVPEDVSVMGCDDNALCDFVSPKLTTIRLSERDQATYAAREVLRLLSQSGGRVERISGALIVRGTCKIRTED
ncbi:MAG: LacI family DNA-binding transcriptional regulator [Clostridia bacterium]|nr:LacI family DNA-binding transcriptional regulator [Clostridia bacterium]MBQ8972983.1 LacI family DNA-binding transcriptional regulator [Clostridia bacterium]